MTVVRDGDGLRMAPDGWARLDQLRRMSYADYLETPEWEEIRAAAVRRAGGRCQGCNTAIGLEVHHRTYERRGQEQLIDLAALCGDCHRAVHIVKDLRDRKTRKPRQE